jgi:outer membrane murein-binding lipoprotein Lpp
MKKISMILFAVVLTVSFAACGGSSEKKDGAEAEATTVETTTVEEVAPAAEAGSADEFIANYDSFLNELLPIMEKVAAGDAAATQEYTKLAEKAQQLAMDAQKYAPNFTPEQAQKWQDMSIKYAEAVQKMTPQP